MVGAILALGLCTWLPAAANAPGGAARALITTPIDEVRFVRLSGNTRPEANAANDRGRVPDSLEMEHMQLLLKRPAEREASLRSFTEALQDRASPHYHRWLKVGEFREQFGLAQTDLDALSGWLERSGFTVNAQYPSSMIIDFTGTAGQVRRAFHTEIHRLEVRGKHHIANMSDPAIPAALAPAVVGIISLHDFRPHPNFKSRARMAVKSAYTAGSSTLVAPADLATIYNFSPLFTDGISGQGQTIVVIEDSDVYNNDNTTGSPDWNTFRATFGLAKAYPDGSFTQEHPPLPSSGGAACADPGVVDGDEFEAELDAEWASAAAPSAAIVVASCANVTKTVHGVTTILTPGVLIALENLINGTNPPEIVSISYGECEAGNGATANAAYSSIYSQAVTSGISVVVAAGDEGAASCDADSTVATHGIGVSGLASTPYDVAVGGTDFGDTYAGTSSSYWVQSNGNYYGSALSYIPEIPWNDSCASALIATVEGDSPSYGSSGFCNSTVGNTDFKTTVSGSGGPSGCATGSPSTSGVVGGTCQGTAKPSWQSLSFGNPRDGVRDLPDVSLFAGNGLWGHYYIVCDSDTADGGSSCSGAPSTWSGGGGTSFAAPIMAGIQALVNQATGAKQGNPNPSYYALAAAEYGTGGSSACNSSLGNAASSSCVFYDVTLGDMDVDCMGTNNCYLPSGTIGVLSTSATTFKTAYGATTGWDFATGIGSVNAENLVNGWNASNVTVSGSDAVNFSGQISYVWTVGNTGPRTATAVVLSTTLPSGFSLVSSSGGSGCTVKSQVLTCTIASIAIGGSVGLTLVIQPSNVQTADLSFTVTSSNGVLFPASDTVNTAVNLPGDGGGTVNRWALAAMGLRGTRYGACRHRVATIEESSTVELPGQRRLAITVVNSTKKTSTTNRPPPSRNLDHLSNKVMGSVSPAKRADASGST
jgi:uncharacterized repeat protein (TIGR01451 family)